MNGSPIKADVKRYDPNLQRWVNRDPIQEWGGVNLSEFSDNLPLGLIDAKGTAESVANSFRRDAAKAIGKGVAAYAGGQGAKRYINAADKDAHGDGKSWCTPFR